MAARGRESERAQAAFSLIELLVFLGLLGAFSSLFFSFYVEFRAWAERSRMVADLTVEADRLLDYLGRDVRESSGRIRSFGPLSESGGRLILAAGSGDGAGRDAIVYGRDPNRKTSLVRMRVRGGSNEVLEMSTLAKNLEDITFAWEEGEKPALVVHARFKAVAGEESREIETRARIFQRIEG